MYGSDGWGGEVGARELFPAAAAGLQGAAPARGRCAGRRAEPAAAAASSAVGPLEKKDQVTCGLFEFQVPVGSSS